MTKEEFLAATPAAAQKHLDGLSIIQLVVFHNQLTGAGIKKFADRPEGIKRIWKWRKAELAAAPPPAAAEESATAPKKGKVLGTHKDGGSIIASPRGEDEETKAKVQEPSSTATETQGNPPSSAEAVTPGVNGSVEEIPGKPASEESVATTPKASEEIKILTEAAAKPALNGRVKGSDERIVKLLKTINPKRAGSAAFDRFELYQDGMTIKEALAAGVRREDIKWDTDHKLIELAEPVAH